MFLGNAHERVHVAGMAIEMNRDDGLDGELVLEGLDCCSDALGAHGVRVFRDIHQDGGGPGPFDGSYGCDCGVAHSDDTITRSYAEGFDGKDECVRSIGNTYRSVVPAELSKLFFKGAAFLSQNEPSAFENAGHSPVDVVLLCGVCCLEVTHDDTVFAHTESYFPRR